MKIVSHAQNSKVWKEWRGKGLGASDAAAVMGVSPWTTPFALWLDKTGLSPREPANEFALAAMKRGTELEPLARVHFEALHGPFPALSAEHDAHPFIRASLDGYNPDKEAILEIKCPGKVDHAKAVAGDVPAKYVPQIQQQLLVTGAKVCYYYSWDGKDSYATVLVYPDPIYLAKLQGALISFWQKVELQIPPPLGRGELSKFVKRVGVDLKRLNDSVKALEVVGNSYE